MKWMAMNDLNWHTTDFENLGSKTLFKNVVKIIFKTPQNNKIILKFYKWAKSKSENNSTFKNFAEETFVKYFCYYFTCEDGIQEILNFIRSQINIENILERRSHEIISMLCSEDLNFREIFPFCARNFTCKEFKILLFQNSLNSQHDDHLVSIALASAQRTTERTDNSYMEFAENNFDVFLKVVSTKKEILNKIREYTDLNGMDNVHCWIRIVVTYSFLNKLAVSNMVVNGIKAIFHPPQLKMALLQCISYYGTIFHVAAKRQDLFFMQILWKMAKEYLTVDELEHLLCTPDDNGFCM